MWKEAGLEYNSSLIFLRHRITTNILKIYKHYKIPYKTNDNKFVLESTDGKFESLQKYLFLLSVFPYFKVNK